MKYLVAVFCTGLVCLMLGSAIAADNPKTVEQLYLEKSALNGKQVVLHGKVVKVNNGIMNRNFLHIQDGTGEPGSNNITVTSDQTANVGDEVTITGKMVLDKDFGAGYVYPLLVEEAKITNH